MLSSKTKRELKIDQRQILIDSIEIGISSPHQILTWGERLLPNGKKAGLIKNSKTVNYKRFTPFRDGLFCERIFGPVTSFVCACGKKQPHSKVTFCEKCEVEYIDARSRRYRLGYISLLSPVTHIWYLKGRPSYLSLFLGKRKKTVVALAYCNAYLIEHAISKKNDNVKNGHIWPYMQSPSNSKTFFQGLSNPGKGREERRLKINGSTTPLFGVKNVKKTKTLANKASCYKSPCKALLCTCNKKLCPQTALFAELCSFSLSPKAYPCPCPCPLGKGKGKGKGMGKASRSIPFFHKFSCKRGTRDPRRVSASKSIRCKAVFDERKRETKLESSFSLKLSKKVRFTTFKNFEQNSTNTNSHLVKGKVFSKRKNCHQRFEKKEYLCSEASSYGTYFYARQHTLPFLPTLVSHFYLRDALLNFTYSLASYDDFPIVEYCRIKRREPLRDVHRFMAHRTVEPFKNGINKILPHDALYSYKSITDPKLRFITSTFQPSNKSELFTRKSFTKPYSLKGGKSTLTEKKISSPCCRQKRQHVSLGKNCKAKVPQRYKYKGKEYKSSCVQSSALFAKACKAPRTNLLAYKALLCSRSFALVRKELCTQTALLCASRKKLCDSYARSFVRKRKKVMAWASSAKQSEQISLQSEQISDLYARRFVRFARRFVTSRFVRTCSRSFVLPITLPAHAHASALRARARVRTGAKAKACKKICTPCESTCIGLKSAQVHEISNSCKVTPKIVHASQKSGRRFGCARTCHKVVQNTADFSGNEGPTTLLEESNRSLLSGLELIAIREILSYTGGGALQQLLQQFNQHDFCKFLFAEAQILRRVFETQISSYTSKETDSDFPDFVRGDRKRGTPLPLPLPVPYGQPLPLPKERHGHGNDHGHRHKNELEDLVARSFTWACRTSASTSTNRRFVRRFVRSEGLQSSANKSTCVQSSLQSSALQLLCASRKKLCTCTQGALYANKSTGIVPYGQVATNLRFVKLCKPLCCALDTVNETRSFATLTQEALYARRFVPLARTQICSAWARASRERTKKEDDFQNKTPDLRKKQILRISRRIYKVSRRLKIAQLLTRNHRKPEWMILSHLPVLPPDLRPILQMSEKVIVASDLNIMYQRVIYRNNRHLRVRFIDFHLVTAIQRLVQDAVDRLIENGKGGLKPYYTQGGRPLKSLSDILKGKKGRFRLNLLGKRVDFSGRSVIVVSPLCQIHECGLPKDIALELYHYFLLRQLIVKKYCASIVTAKKMIKSKSSLMWDILRLLMYHHPVLLNRAPTLHRLGIQAFQPKLVLGNAILLHPLVCSGFNADFDGDQMGVHLPLSFAARAESWDLLWSRNNLLSPATGQPMLVPSQDMVLGFYYITAQAYKSTRLVRMQNSSKAKACKAELCSCSRSFALAYKCNYKYKSKICKKICKKLCKEICSPCFALAGKELCTQGALYARSFVRKRKKGMAEARAKVREKTKEKYKSTILHDVNEQKTKINSFLNLKEIITSLQSGKIKLHHPVWLHWRGQIENEEGSQRPLELRVYGFGVQKEVYEKHISLSFFTKNKKDRINLYSPKECVSSYKSSYVVRMQNNCKAPRTTAKLREGLQSEQSGALYARSFVRKKLCTQTNLLAYKEDKKLVNTRLLKAESQPCYLNLSGHEASKSVRKGSDICMAVQHKGKTFAFTEKDKPTPLLQKKRAVSRAEKGSRVSTSDCSSLLKKKRTQLQKQKQQICIKPEAYYVRTTAGRVLMNNLISF